MSFFEPLKKKVTYVRADFCFMNTRRELGLHAKTLGT
jgi:hypothetical protein